MITILDQCKREVRDFPQSIREDLADALTRLEEGHTLSLPLSRPMPSIGRGVSELRLKDPSGAYRVFYVCIAERGVFVLYGFKKTSQQTPRRVLQVVQLRYRTITAL